MGIRAEAAGALGVALIGVWALFHVQPTSAQDAGKTTWDGIYSEAQADRGKGAYKTACLSCHGEELAGQDMTPPLAGSQFLSNWNGLSVGDLAERVRTTMPLNKPGSLSRDQIADVLAYIMNYNKFPAGSADLPKDVQMQKTFMIQATRDSK
jgi:mono/diheme cytochrome c family protein